MTTENAQNDAGSTRDPSRSETVRPPVSPPEATHSWPIPNDGTLTHPVSPRGGSHRIDELPPNLRDHPRYHVLRRLGQGGMGQVFVAEHRLMGRLVALKTINLRLADSPAVVDRFLREIRATAKLSHPNVVVAHDAEATPDHLFLIMEYLEGRDLRAVAQESAGLDPSTACAYAYQAALALNHAHKRGVIHRDIKPGNLLVVPDEFGSGPGLVKVLDFGLAKIAGEVFPGTIGTPAGFAMGTRGFMSPEQSTDARAVGVHADIFSLGRTLYFLLTGRNPYPNGVQSLMAEEAGKDPVIPLAEIRPGVAGEVRQVMLRMSARRSEDRFQSCEEVLAALAPLCRSEPVAQSTVERPWWRIWPSNRT